MHKKILGICAALVAFAAFAIVPAMAAASPVLTENGTAVAAGSKITATGEEKSEFLSGFINVTCNDYWMTGSVHRNSSNIIEGTIENATFENKNASTGATEDCSSNLGPTRVKIPGLTNEGGSQHWCVISGGEVAKDKAQIVPHSCTGTGGAFTFVLENTGGATCRYTRTLPITATYETGVTPVTLKMEGEPEFTREETSSFLCSPTGKIKSLSFNLETEDGTGLSIS